MTIVDNHFGGEFITNKGKVYKFDSIECLFNFMRKNSLDEKKAQAILVIDHTLPGQLVNARQAYFLHSPNMPSPMGAFLSAFASEDSLRVYQSRLQGDSWNFEQVRENIK